MQAFTTHAGLYAPLDRGDVDTYQVVPKQFLEALTRELRPNPFFRRALLAGRELGEVVSTASRQGTTSDGPQDDMDGPDTERGRHSCERFARGERCVGHRSRTDPASPE